MIGSLLNYKWTSFTGDKKMQAATNIKKRLGKVFDNKQAGVLSEVITDAYSDLVKTGDFN